MTGADRPEAESSYFDQRLASCKRWWEVTKNPLYIWEAIAWSRGNLPPAPIPDWCLPYLGEAAKMITDLHWATVRGGCPADAYKKVPEKLGFVRQGKKNAFAAAI